MKTLIVTLMLSLVASNVSAFRWSDKSWDDPEKPFNASSGRIVKGPVKIDWRVVSDVLKECNKLTNNAHGKNPIQACAIWRGNKCTIVTSKNPTMHSVGHEVRHCFYGHWH